MTNIAPAGMDREALPLPANPAQARAVPEEVDIMWEVWIGDSLEAASSDEIDAHHYLAVYSQDGPARLVKAETRRIEVSSGEGEKRGG